MSQYVWVKRKRNLEVNIIPLIDVLTILIFFSLLSMRVHDVSYLQIALPKIDTATTGAVEEVIRIGITDQGEFYLNEVQVTEAELRELLKDAAALDRRQPVLIMSDEEGAVKHLTRVMDFCRESGFDRFRILSR